MGWVLDLIVKMLVKMATPHSRVPVFNTRLHLKLLTLLSFCQCRLWEAADN